MEGNLFFYADQQAPVPLGIRLGKGDQLVEAVVVDWKI